MKVRKKRKNLISDEDVRKIREFSKNSTSVMEISKKFNVYKHTIYRI